MCSLSPIKVNTETLCFSENNNLVYQISSRDKTVFFNLTKHQKKEETNPKEQECATQRPKYKR